MSQIEIIRDKRTMFSRARELKAAGQTIAFVPTMGYLHEGHLSLLHKGRKLADVLVLSIYVNPAQFAQGEDLDVYPRDEDGDLQKAMECGTDIAFCPSQLYDEHHSTTVTTGEMSQILCGQTRPTHFDGVTTVVTKLFNIVLPDFAIFGAKDFQQLTLIKRIVNDLDMLVEVVGMPIVREADGLAMSSRNAYLKGQERSDALALSKGLEAAKRLFDAGERSSDKLIARAGEVITETPNVRIDYVEVRDTQTLAAVDKIANEAVIAGAIFIGSARLLDNIVLGAT